MNDSEVSRLALTHNIEQNPEVVEPRAQLGSLILAFGSVHGPHQGA